MAYYDSTESLETKEEALKYMKLHGIMTDATFSKLNDDSNTKKRMKPIYDYLKNNGLKVSNDGFFDPRFGGIYYMFDEDCFNIQTAVTEVKKIIDIWNQSQKND